MSLPPGLKHPGGGVPAKKTQVELAYASSKIDRITRVIMSDTAAYFWFAQIAKWSDVLRVIIRDLQGTILEDRTIDERITSATLRERAAWVTDRGSITAYAHWSHP